MHTLRHAALLAGWVGTACQSYAPAPVDLRAHARAFAARVPDAASIREFAERLHQQDPSRPTFDLSDGLELSEARCVALLFNADLRTVRLRADVLAAAAEHAGSWPDPELSGAFEKILKSVEHPWLAGGAIGLTLPITGRPGLEKDLAHTRHALALLEARSTEAHVLDALDAAWTRWSAGHMRADLIADLVQRLTALEAIATRLAGAQLLTQPQARAFTLERVARQAHAVQAHAAVAVAEIELWQVLGLPVESPLQLLPSIAVPDRVPARAAATEDGSAHLLDSPRVALARGAHAVAERKLALAVRKQWPELTLLPGFGEEDAQPRATLGFTLPLPLWNGNARDIAETRAERAAAAEALRISLERATLDLARADVRRAAAQSQRQLVDSELVPLAEQQVADGRRLAELGELDPLLILDALTRAYEAKALAIDAALAEAEATIERNALFWPTLTPSLTTSAPTEEGR